MATLVVYATKHGSTGEVADRIATVLRDLGDDCMALPVREVGKVTGVQAVVVGGPLYQMRWHRDVRRFLRRQRRALATMPVAVFALGPRTLEDDAWSRSRVQLDHALEAFPWLVPVTTTLFGGADPPGRSSPRRDVRDWGAIDRWAAKVHAELRLAERRT